MLVLSFHTSYYKKYIEQLDVNMIMNYLLQKKELENEE
jgi:hypothetical protein